ncbi:LuxR C-terminal-related transcriptional regulator [Streptomyces sp. NPDC087850]|uniref:helix-turn-helix transcriptional regulator n=1 Tax=Streptomyces sp. NPDC087850 TaxID=3365809 RepID=UPI00382B6D88
MDIRLIREPDEIRRCDDVVLFYGSGMARDLCRFADEAPAGMPPAAVLAHRLDWDDVRLALDRGAASYLLENRYAFLLSEALLCTARGASILDPVIAAEQVKVATRARAEERERAGLEAASAPDLARLRELSRRERQVMELLVAGLGVRDVAQKMFLTDKTVRNYLTRIYTKLNVRSRSEAILYCLGRLEAPGSDPRRPTSAGRAPWSTTDRASGA